MLVIDSREYRTQAQNRDAARARLVELLQHAAREPKKRRPTRPKAGAKEKRLEVQEAPRRNQVPPPSRRRRLAARVATRLLDIAPVRLRRQMLAGGAAADAPAVVQWMGAVQAQDYAGARWAIGLRAKGATDATVARAFDAGAILRTHMMRPTWHFVAPQDIRWMQALTSPRVHAGSRSIYRKLELDERVLAKGRAVFERALAGGAHLTRDRAGRRPRPGGHRRLRSFVSRTW